MSRVEVLSGPKRRRRLSAEQKRSGCSLARPRRTRWCSAPSGGVARPQVQPYPWMVRRNAMVNTYYVYAVDRDFGPSRSPASSEMTPRTEKITFGLSA